MKQLKEAMFRKRAKEWRQQFARSWTLPCTNGWKMQDIAMLLSTLIYLKKSSRVCNIIRIPRFPRFWWVSGSIEKTFQCQFPNYFTLLIHLQGFWKLLLQNVYKTVLSWKTKPARHLYSFPITGVTGSLKIIFENLPVFILLLDVQPNNHPSWSQQKFVLFIFWLNNRFWDFTLHRCPSHNIRCKLEFLKLFEAYFVQLLWCHGNIHFIHVIS